MADELKKPEKELSVQDLRDMLASHRSAAVYVNGARLKNVNIKVVKDPDKYEVHISTGSEGKK